MKSLRVWRLRSFLSGLLVLTMVATIGLVGALILAVRIPQLEQESKNDVARETRELAARVELLLGSLESQVELLSQTLQYTPMDRANALLDRATGDGHAIRAIYLVSNEGVVLAAGVAAELRSRREDLLGSDLSANQLFRAAQLPRQMVWGDKYLSALSGAVTVGLAYPVGEERILLAEVPLSYVLSTVQLAAGWRSSSIWLVDRMGEIVADTDRGRDVGARNLLNTPLVQAALKDQPLPEVFSFGGHTLAPAVAHSKALDWYFIAGSRTGLENGQIRNAVLFVVSGLLGTLMLGLLLAPFWASLMIRPLRDIVRRAERIASDEVYEAWQSGPILEFNHLGADLDTLAKALKEREQKAQAIFNATPVPMTVTDMDSSYEILDVNEAWCREFGYSPEAVSGLRALDIHLWRDPHARAEFLAGMKDGRMTTEAWLVRRDGSALLTKIFACIAQVGASRLMLWATVDITETRKTDQALRELNAELETRVSRRTEALASVNAELSGAIAHLRQTQSDLVRAEKMAALGGLVAGVAHELNTPLGNGLMAVTALADEVRQFKITMQHGLRKAALESFVDSAAQATDIAVRNLHRAADLVTSFKQVAVDQTSSQRRPFELAEVVAEMVTSLRPSLNRTPFQVEMQVPATGLCLDSFPGPLGQVIGNLINNAVLHGFEGRDAGIVRITGERAADSSIVLRVSDDGRGIPPALIDRIFDPFVTTRMGRGGTGLGLHIAYNAVTNLLGGTMAVRSQEGTGTTFEIRLPDVAPRHTGVSDAMGLS